ncbi:hypothetical protein [Flavobacterium orientale]|uniref:Uncharacterized protein n=1 Tax=Flavobacterium orientale TaxID=1756020 RepID=A0A917DEC8_9FLAO|nr:hypothetical protein [Flavobacterium orientale]GGD33323.1 hypothetical protein GCM10011343_24200 [Flavobacterium orientale]
MSKNCDVIDSSDVTYIIENPWDVSEYEWNLQDKSDLEGTHLFILNKLKIASNGGFSRMWKTSDQKPIAILGCLKIGDKEFETFFIASKHMQDHTLKISFEMRDMLREQSVNFKGYTCYLYSISNHPNQMKWFKFLGFINKPERDTGLNRYFEYVSPIK